MISNFIQMVKESKKETVNTKIKCPRCGVIYEVIKMESKTVKCMDCGAEYLQPIHNVDNPEFIRQAVYRCKGEKH